MNFIGILIILFGLICEQLDCFDTSVVTPTEFKQIFFSDDFKSARTTE